MSRLLGSLFHRICRPFSIPSIYPLEVRYNPKMAGFAPAGGDADGNRNIPPAAGDGLRPSAPLDGNHHSLLTFAVAAANALEPLVMKYIFDRLGGEGTLQAVLLGVAMLAGLALLREIGGGFSNWLSWRTRIGIQYAFSTPRSRNCTACRTTSTAGRASGRS